MQKWVGSQCKLAKSDVIMLRSSVLDYVQEMERKLMKANVQWVTFQSRDNKSVNQLSKVWERDNLLPLQVDKNFTADYICLSNL